MLEGYNKDLKEMLDSLTDKSISEKPTNIIDFESIKKISFDNASFDNDHVNDYIYEF